MPITAALIAGGSAILGNLVAPEPKGSSGGVSSSTQSGNSGLNYTPVGLDSLEITPFEYKLLNEMFKEQQEPQEMMYGGPLYAKGGGDLNKALLGAAGLSMVPGTLGDFGRTLSGGLTSMQEQEPKGLMSLLFGLLTEDEEEEDKEKSIVPGLQNGGPLYLAEGDDIYRQEVIAQRPEGIMSVNNDIEPEIDIPQPSATVADFKKELDDMLRRQLMQDLVMNEIPDLVSMIMANRNQKANVRGRGNIVPGNGRGSGRSISNQDFRVAGTTVNPFSYRRLKNGGTMVDGVLDRPMFAANYMPNGGEMEGPGGPKDDLIPVMASNGEFMLSKAAVDQAGGGNHSEGIAMLEAFNELGNQRYGR